MDGAGQDEGGVAERKARMGVDGQLLGSSEAALYDPL